MRAVVGRLANHLARMTAPATVGGPGADARYPVAFLFDGRPRMPFRWAGDVSGAGLTFDLDVVTNGGLEAWASGVPSGWAVSGTVTQETTTKREGAAAAKLATAGGSLTQKVWTRAGEQLNLVASLRGDGSATAQLSVRNLLTGLYLTSAGAWSASVAFVGQQTAASWRDVDMTAWAVESYEACGDDVAQLELVLSQSGAGACYFDGLHLWPSTSFAGIFGHNWAPRTGPELRSSTDGFSSVDTLRQALAVRQPSFGAELPALVTDRYWRLLLAGSSRPGDYPGIGELVLGQWEKLPSYADYPWVLEQLDPQTRVSTDEGEEWVALRGARGRRKARWTSTYMSESDHEAALAVLSRSRQGAYPMVLIPTEPEPGVLFYGRLSEGPVAFTTQTFTSHLAEWELSEMPFPRF